MHGLRAVYTVPGTEYVRQSSFIVGEFEHRSSLTCDQKA